MAIVTLGLAKVKDETTTRPRGCPYCGSVLLQGWGTVPKPLRDTQLKEVEVRRFRCCDCQRTFRHYPKGVGPADQSQRLQQLAAICWVLGLSLRGVSGILGAFGIQLCHMSVWRDVQALANVWTLPPPPQGVRVLGVDGFYEQDDVPATNNATERTIGRWRIRSRSVRGFKSWPGLVNAFTLCNSAIV